MKPNQSEEKKHIWGGFKMSKHTFTPEQTNSREDCSSSPFPDKPTYTLCPFLLHSLLTFKCMFKKVNAHPTSLTLEAMLMLKLF